MIAGTAERRRRMRHGEREYPHGPGPTISAEMQGSIRMGLVYALLAAALLCVLSELPGAASVRTPADRPRGEADFTVHPRRAMTIAAAFARNRESLPLSFARNGYNRLNSCAFEVVPEGIDAQGGVLISAFCGSPEEQAAVRTAREGERVLLDGHWTRVPSTAFLPGNYEQLFVTERVRFPVRRGGDLPASSAAIRIRTGAASRRSVRASASAVQEGGRR